MLVRPDPIPGESLTGYLLRLSEANRYPSPYWITNMGGVHQLDPYLPSERLLKAVSRLSGHPRDVLMQLTLVKFADLLNPPDAPPGELHDSAVARFVQHRRHGLRVCPECIRTTGTLQLAWQLRMVTTCLIHRCLLIERCPACHHPVRMENVSSRTCRCGHSLLAVSGPEVDSGSRGYQAQATIQELLRTSPGQSCGLGVSDWPASLDLYQRWFCSFPRGRLSVDSFSTDRRSERSVKSWEPVEVDHVHFTLAVESLRGGQGAFHHWCRTKLLVPEEQQYASGYLRTFTKLLRLVAANPGLDHFSSWLKTFLQTEWDGGHGSRVKRMSLKTSAWTGLEAAAGELNCRSWAIVYLIDAGLLRGRLFPIGVTGMVGGLVDRESLAAYRERRGDTMSLYEAAGLLGVSPETLAIRYYQGVIRAHRGPITDGTREIRLHRSDLQSEGFIEEKPWEGDGQLPVEHAERVLGCTSIVLEALNREGLVRIERNAISGWQTFLSEYVWEHQAGRLLGVRLPAFRRWVAGGRIAPVFVVGMTGVYRRSDLACFEPRNCCGTKEAARLLGLGHPQQVYRQFVQSGRLRPIAGPGVDFGTELIFDRRDVLRLAPPGSRESAAMAQCLSVLGDEGRVSTEEAAALLGMSIGAFQRAYRSTNKLVPIAREPGGRKNLYQRSAVEILARQRGGHAPA